MIDAVLAGVLAGVLTLMAGAGGVAPAVVGVVGGLAVRMRPRSGAARVLCATGRLGDTSPHLARRPRSQYPTAPQ